MHSLAASPTRCTGTFNLGAGCPGSREIHVWLVPREQSPAKVTYLAPSFPPLNCLPALSQTFALHLFFPLVKAAVTGASSSTGTGCPEPPGHRATRLVPISKNACFCSLHNTHGGFCKPISPCHQTVGSLTEQKKIKSSSFYDLGFPIPTSCSSQAAWGPSGGE